jgi:hypothetical protein
MLNRDPPDLHILPWPDASGKKAQTRSNPQVQGLWEQPKWVYRRRAPLATLPFTVKNVEFDGSCEQAPAGGM